MDKIDKRLLKIEEGKKKIDEIRSVLKSNYFGIDNVIDSVMDKIETWYTFEDVLIKPTVICLWGMTGIGKTNLVRDIVKLLGMYDKFCEVDVSKTVGSDVSRRFLGRGSWNANQDLSSKIYSVIPDNRMKGVLLIDEVTKIDFKNNDGRYSDIWPILSDGRLGNGLSYMTRLDNIIETLEESFEDFDRSKTREAYNKATISENHGYYDKVRNPYIEPTMIVKPWILDEVVEIVESMVGDITFDDVSVLFDYLDYNPDIQRFFPFGARLHFSNLIENGSLSIPKLLKIPGIVFNKPLIKFVSIVRDRVKQEFSKVKGKDPLCYSKLLIFVSGNVDGLYKHSSDVSIGADELHEITSKLVNGNGISELKTELLKVFKPEEVSRFGSNHIIYTSLNKESFMKVINKTLKTIEEETFSTTGIKVNLRTKAFMESIYNNDVVASQGVRPLISKIQSDVSSVLPDLIKKGLEKVK